VVVSTDLSHYLPYDEAKAIDSETAEHVKQLDFAGIDSDAACGCFGLRGLLAAAKRHGLEGRVLDLRSSGDTAGDKKRVVGYGAFAFFEPPGHKQ
jgi:AmmeMemoRadiSam system protein B